MNNLRTVLLVMRQEIYATLRKAGFVIAAFGVPIVIGLIAIIVAISNSRSTGAPDVVETPASAGVQGYVDPGGWIRDLPADVRDSYRAYPDEDQAQAALETAEIDGYFIIAPDYLETGELTYVTLKFDPIGSSLNLRPFESLLTLNLFEDQPGLGRTVLNPVELQFHQLEPPDSDEIQDNWMAEQLPFFMVILLYMVILMPASTLVSSITDEKKNRVLEVLISSISPSQFFAGKLLALGLLGLLQTLVWVGMVWGVGRFGGSALSLPPGFSIPTHLIAWSVVFSMTGYAMYGTQMAGIGALAPNANDTRSLTMIVLAPLILGYFFNIIYLNAPESPVLVVLSMFPLTAPVVLIGRMASLGLPAWQLAVSLLLQVVTVYAIFSLFSRLFRAQALLSGQPLTFGRLVKAIRTG